MTAKKMKSKKNKKIYGPWEIDPHMPKHPKKIIRAAQPEMISMKTMHEGKVTYLRFWNFWVRSGTPANEPTDSFSITTKAVQNR